MNELIHIDPNGMITSKELYDFLGLRSGDYSRWCKTNIEENDFAEDGRDYEVFRTDAENPLGGRPTTNYLLSISFAKKLCMLSKSPRGELARNYFIEVEKRYQQITQPNKPVALEDLIILQAQSVKELKAVVHEQGQLLTRQNKQIETIKDTIVERKEEWRNWVNNRLVAVGRERGDMHSQTRADSYKLLEERAGCNLDLRLKNMKINMKEAGTCKTKIKLANKLDVIEAEPRLKEIYSMIVKELYVQYVA